MKSSDPNKTKWIHQNIYLSWTKNTELSKYNKMAYLCWGEVNSLRSNMTVCSHLNEIQLKMLS